MARNYRVFFAICKAVGKDYKEAVYEFTEGRKVSLSSLNDGELKELLIKARSWQAPKPPVYIKPGDAQRKKLIALAGKMNWGASTPDIIRRLNAFLQSKFNKDLNEMNLIELHKAIWMVEKMYSDYLKKI